jgi:galactonate dehydratase
LAAYIAASLQLAAAIPNLELLEYQPTMYKIANHMMREPFEQFDGHVVVPDRPGLGIDFNEEFLTRHIRSR